MENFEKWKKKKFSFQPKIDSNLATTGIDFLKKENEFDRNENY